MTVEDRAGPTQHNPSAWQPHPPKDRGDRRPQILLGALLGLAALAVIYAASSLIIPIVFAVMLAFLLRPAVRALGCLHIPSGIAAILVTLIAAALPLMVALQVTPAAMRWMDRAPEAFDKVNILFDRFRTPLQKISEVKEKMDAATEVSKKTFELPMATSKPDQGKLVISYLGSWAYNLIAVLLLLLFMLVYGEDLLLRATRTMRSWRRRGRARLMLRRLETHFGRYLATIIMINVGLGTVQAGAMWLLGVPDPLIWGVMCALLNCVPYVGAIVGTLVVAMVAMVSISDPGMTLAVPLVYLALTSIEGYLVTPLVLGYRFHLNPLIVLLVIMIGGWMWGISGALLAVPMLVAAGIALADSPRLGRLVCVIGNDPLPPAGHACGSQALQAVGSDPALPASSVADTEVVLK